MNYTKITGISIREISKGISRALEKIYYAIFIDAMLVTIRRDMME